MNRSQCAMINSFVLTNMTPQHPKFNRCTWRWLEGNVRHWAAERSKVYVITGAVFDNDGNGVRDSHSATKRIETHNRVALPTQFYKIILHEKPNGYIETMTFLLPHRNSKPKFADRQTFLGKHLTTIAALEALTGSNFLAKLEADNPAKAKAVRQFKASSMWATEERPPDGIDKSCEDWAT